MESQEGADMWILPPCIEAFAQKHLSVNYSKLHLVCRSSLAVSICISAQFFLLSNTKTN